MLSKLIVLMFTVLLTCPIVFAGDFYLITINKSSIEDQNALQDYPGRCWGKTVDKIFLAGTDDDICWLNDRNIGGKIVEMEEPSTIFLNYGNADLLQVAAEDIIDKGDDYFITRKAVFDAKSYRRLDLRKLPLSISNTPSEEIFTYDPYIDELISEVSDSGIMAFLSGLSGEEEVTIGGQPYTIDTRYSGTEGNLMAAQYLREVLESYGYEVEYHAFYGGQPRHTSVYDASNAWVVTENSEGLRTADGGNSWNSMDLGTNESLWGVDNIGADSVWITGDNGVIRFSYDGGENFTYQDAGTSSYLFGLCFVNPQYGWIAADGGRIYHTSTGGEVWERQTTSTSVRLYDVSFADTDNGWACGRDGVIIHTSSGGESWENQSSGTGQRLYGIHFTDENNGWAVGWGGAVVHTTDGGSEWNNVYIGSNVEKYHVHFTDAMHGCIVGWNGEIFTTTDGGDNWEQQTSGTTQDFYGVEFADNMNGYACGNGVVAKTTDGGITWVNQTQAIESAWLNTIATKTGAVNPDEHVIICAHMDDTSEDPTVRAPGADDNGSGTVAVIESARIFAGVEFTKTIKFCLWTGEEQGLHGSAAYAADASSRGDNIIGVYNFDMIAWDGNDDFVGELHCGTMTSSQDIGDIFEEVVTDYDINLNTVYLTWGSTDRSDHASFWDYNYPAILGIEDFTNDFHPYYHTTDDNMENINQAFFYEYTKAAIGATATLADPTMTDVDDDNPLMPSSTSLIGSYP
ncbi:MAG: M20/M25/M40 family metallo-hydrolase, partial [candidate division Zixibacteria bacterium]|nr:M20/M25/M40 family metallo-hydrolase [candidate division Zixibacteria bacterium]